ncbi:AGAP009795-PA-like protein [Anopheles sinensis]|uniref:AGAP009795-PA-like protein n=1 Tax=Anopheles sinensis TaxID=74873 RepID=A0A084WG70_ANOSI|nr:AGAP009795-PA-like protein [Anopheles sinensis]
MARRVEKQKFTTDPEDLNYATNNEQLPPPISVHQPPPVPGRNLNINLPESGPRGNATSNAILRLEVELRDKHANPGANRRGVNKARPPKPPNVQRGSPNVDGSVPLEKVLDELLKKLEVERVIWHPDKDGQYYQVVFPLAAGDPCETTLHCLTELGIGVKHNSSVSVLPCSVSYDGLNDTSNEDEYGDDAEESSKWNNFVDSIRSKLTVKQVVDGVRAGGSLSFDYLLLIVTADSLAALGLVENNAPNIVAAMLVSPLMGPVMSITFGTIIADRELVKVGFTALALGMFISIVFGFIFGLILGTTEMPWGFGDFPTEEMKGRGNARSLWMGILWALTSGSGVAVALLQGSAGPLIGVAISASLLPPVVNCGLFWALACIWLIYEDIKMPHLKGELYTGNSSYEFIYTNYIPTEFLINGIVSGLLTVINVICIFITAIIVLKIKEVAAPYTSSPDLRRFWETDIRTARTANRTTIRRNRGGGEADIMSTYAELENDPKARNLENALEQALKEAVDDDTYRKVKRMSYSSNAASEIGDRLFGHGAGSGAQGMSTTGGQIGNPMANHRSSGPKTTADLKLLEKLVTTLLETHNSQGAEGAGGRGDGVHRSGSVLGRFRPMSRSFRTTNSLRRRTEGTGANANGSSLAGTAASGSEGTGGGLMPTIQESSTDRNSDRGRRNSWNERAGNVRRVLNTIANAPQRFSQSLAQDNEEERSNLTQNIL